MTQPQGRQQNFFMSFDGSLAVGPRCDPGWESNQNAENGRNHSELQGSCGELLAQEAPGNRKGSSFHFTCRSGKLPEALLADFKGIGWFSSIFTTATQNYFPNQLC